MVRESNKERSSSPHQASEPHDCDHSPANAWPMFSADGNPGARWLTDVEPGGPSASRLTSGRQPDRPVPTSGVPSCRRAQRALSNSVRPHGWLRCSAEPWSVVRGMHGLQSCGQDPEVHAVGTPDAPWVRSSSLLWRRHHAPRGKQSGRAAASRDADSSQYLRKWTLAHSMLPSFGMPVRTLSRSARPSSARRRAVARPR